MIGDIGNSQTLLMAGVLGVLTASIAAWTQIYLRRHLGKSNGEGPVTQMMQEQNRLTRAESTAAAYHRAEDRLLFGIVFKRLGIEMPILEELTPPVGVRVEDQHDDQPAS